MKKIIFALTVIAVSGTSCVKEVRNGIQSTEDTHSLEAKLVGCTSSHMEQGSLLVKFNEDAVNRLEKGEEVLEGIEVAGMTPLFHISEKDRNSSLRQWYEVTFDESITPQEIAEKVALDEDVKSIEYNTLIRHSNSNGSVDCSPAVFTRSTVPAKPSDLPFNDPMLPQQWHLINTGDQDLVPNSVAGADLGVKDAWRLCTGDTRVIVAVFDIGVAATLHPDLIDVMWTNPLEDVNGKDDDGNGYKDDVNGFNFHTNKGKLEFTGGSSCSHGTHVAGSIAARNGNGIGVSSIAGGSGAAEYDGVRIMSCQVFSPKGEMAAISNVAAAFKYAADNGACIAQCSFGDEITGDNEKDTFEKGTVEYEALLDFTNKSNCAAIDRNLAIFSAGNYSKETSLYPGAYPFCISVTAVGPDYLPGGYSNYGTGCDIAAPGGDPCLVEEAEIGTDMRTCILSTGMESTGGGTYNAAGYVYNFGTSMACPQVSGVAALGLSYALKLGKTFSRDEFVSRLLASSIAIDKDLVPGKTKKYFDGKGYVPFDISIYRNKLGAGVVNAWNFLMALEDTPTVITKPGKVLSIDLAEYAGNGLSNLDYEVSIDDASKKSLGIEGDLTVTDGILTLTCTKIGAGKISLSGSISDGREDGFCGEISVVSRSAATNNGGWL